MSDAPNDAVNSHKAAADLVTARYRAVQEFIDGQIFAQERMKVTRGTPAELFAHEGELMKKAEAVAKLFPSGHYVLNDGKQVLIVQWMPGFGKDGRPTGGLFPAVFVHDAMRLEEVSREAGPEIGSSNN